MTLFYSGHREGFPKGETAITTTRDKDDNTGIGLSVIRGLAGFEQEISLERETAWVVMSGKLCFTLDGEKHEFNRYSLFDQSSQAVHASAGTRVYIQAESDVELVRVEVDNSKTFAPRAFSDVSNEHRGKGQVGGTCLRFVRTIFDGSNSDEATELVLGEVITMPGRWSSYPPHHHSQPEIYHYRFTRPQGYGFAQLGDDACLVRNYDTLKIMDKKDHSQAAAPGYGMYYLWAIRHLPGDRYSIPEFTEEHKWTMRQDAAFWLPKDIQ